MLQTLIPSPTVSIGKLLAHRRHLLVQRCNSSNPYTLSLVEEVNVLIDIVVSFWRRHHTMKSGTHSFFCLRCLCKICTLNPRQCEGSLLYLALTSSLKFLDLHNNINNEMGCYSLSVYLYLLPPTFLPVSFYKQFWKPTSPIVGHRHLHSCETCLGRWTPELRSTSPHYSSLPYGSDLGSCNKKSVWEKPTV